LEGTHTAKKPAHYERATGCRIDQSIHGFGANNTNETRRIPLVRHPSKTPVRM
jgi:hypothetical protein